MAPWIEGQQHITWEGPIPQLDDDEVGQFTFEAFLNQQDIGWDQAL
jgi:hypothetical protein